MSSSSTPSYRWAMQYCNHQHLIHNFEKMRWFQKLQSEYFLVDLVLISFRSQTRPLWGTGIDDEWDTRNVSRFLPFLSFVSLSPTLLLSYLHMWQILFSRQILASFSKMLLNLSFFHTFSLSNFYSFTLSPFQEDEVNRTDSVPLTFVVSCTDTWLIRINHVSVRLTTNVSRTDCTTIEAWPSPNFH